MSEPKITEIEITELGADGQTGIATETDESGRPTTIVDADTDTETTEGTYGNHRFVVRIHTDVGTTGEYVTHKTPTYAIEQIKTVGHLLIGTNPLERERIWSDVRFALRKTDCMGLGAVDIALWDFAGRYHESPIHELLGTYRTRIPAYPATSHGNDENGLGTVDAYVEFGETCRSLGFTGYKIHSWERTKEEQYNVTRDRELVRAVGDRLGDEMDLMLDLSGKYATLGEAVTVGRACDEYGYFWIEDPFGIQSQSQSGHRRLRELIDTPVLHLEHVRGLELHADAIVNSATDFVRVNPEYDGGITGAMKIARCAEGLGADVEFHSPGPARRQCIASIRNANYYEITNVDPTEPEPRPPLYEGEYVDGLSSVDDDGTVPVPDGPGLGVTYDPTYLDNSASHTHVIQ